MPTPHPDPTSDARLGRDVFLAPGAQLYGAVEIADRGSVWPHAVVRAEANRVAVGRVSNLQDFAMLHVGYEHSTVIGAFCSVTHHATVHGAIVEDACLIGINAVVMDGAVIGRGSIVAPGAVVREGTVVPPHSIVAGVPAKVLKTRDSERENRLNAWQYFRNARAYARGDHRAWEGRAYRGWLEWMRDAIAADRDLAPDFDPRVE
ncbi:MAG: gamma carbonic anhydrase family protein [Myxococcota bacterium]|nr:gamma carbonic anhydrase family protein [Myxococcales bacterium]